MVKNNYPPGEYGYQKHVGPVKQECSNKHTWYSYMYEELGGGFYYNDEDSTCPECNQVDILNQRY